MHVERARLEGDAPARDLVRVRVTVRVTARGMFWVRLRAEVRAEVRARVRVRVRVRDGVSVSVRLGFGSALGLEVSAPARDRIGHVEKVACRRLDRLALPLTRTRRAASRRRSYPYP